MYGRSLPLSPASLPLCFFLREFFSRVLLSERLEQATVTPTNPIPILLLSFVSQTVVFKLLDFQLRMFKKFIKKRLFTFHNHVPTFKRWHWLDVGDSVSGHLDRHRSAPVSSVLGNSIWLFIISNLSSNSTITCLHWRQIEYCPTENTLWKTMAGAESSHTPRVSLVSVACDPYSDMEVYYLILKSVWNCHYYPLLVLRYLIK